MIWIIPSNQEKTIQIKGGASLSNNSESSIIHLVEGPGQGEWPTGNTNIEISKASLDGRTASVIDGSLFGHKGKLLLSVGEGAQLSSECSNGTVAINDIYHTDVQPRLEVHWNGGSIVNESSESSDRTWDGSYAALNLGGFTNKKYFPQGVLLVGSGTEVRVRGNREPLVYFEALDMGNPSNWKLYSES